MIERYLYRRT